MDDSAPKKGLILAITCLAGFMVVLDVAIVNVALPAIQIDLKLGQSALQWVVIAYSRRTRAQLGARDLRRYGRVRCNRRRDR
jgi:hypothetical protein